MTIYKPEHLIDKSQSNETYRRPAWVEIDLDAIRHNVTLVKGIVSPAVKVMAVVKADGYGHGAVEVSRAALEAGAEWLGVALPEEAVELRRSGIAAPILILSEPPVEAAGLVVENDCSATITSLEVAKALNREAASRGKTARLHLKVDTGMNRIGVAVSQAVGLAESVRSLGDSTLEGIFTHFAKADDVSSDFTDLQLDRLLEVVSDLPAGLQPIKHAANSAATFLNPRTHLDMVRIGIALYGLHPSEATMGKVDLRPALSLKARPSFIKRVPGGSGVSYGHTKLTHKETTVVTVPVGYGDGYPRRFSNVGSVLIRGERRPIIGNVCMDQFMVDAGDIHVTEDDEIILMGEEGGERITADELADLLGTINYEIVCMINKRVPRIYL
ncbi:MAG: alanine racemase [Candidatus Aquicultorales bacterium]